VGVNNKNMTFSPTRLRVILFCAQFAFLTAMTSAQVVTNDYCPVLPDEKVEPNLSVQYEGKTVFLCCGGCVKKFKANPTAYLGNLPQFKTVTDQQVIKQPGVEKATPQQLVAAEHGFWLQFAGWLGRFHVLVVHFPIALFILAALAEVIAMFSAGAQWRQIAGYNLFFSTLSAICASALGWILAIGWTGTPEILATLEKHRTMGLTFTGLSVFCLLLWWIQGKRKIFLLRAFYLFALFAGVIIVCLTGHLGATLVYGANYFKW